MLHNIAYGLLGAAQLAGWEVLLMHLWARAATRRKAPCRTARVGPRGEQHARVLGICATGGAWRERLVAEAQLPEILPGTQCFVLGFAT